MIIIIIIIPDKMSCSQLIIAQNSFPAFQSCKAKCNLVPGDLVTKLYLLYFNKNKKKHEEGFPNTDSNRTR